jgi:hypothetical protein
VLPINPIDDGMGRSTLLLGALLAEKEQSLTAWQSAHAPKRRQGLQLSCSMKLGFGKGIHNNLVTVIAYRLN